MILFLVRLLLFTRRQLSAIFLAVRADLLIERGLFALHASGFAWR